MPTTVATTFRLANRGVGWRRVLRAELLHVLMLPDFERADRIGESWSYPESRAFPELLIDCEEDRTLRAVHSDGEDVLVTSDLVR